MSEPPNPVMTQQNLKLKKAAASINCQEAQNLLKIVSLDILKDVQQKSPENMKTPETPLTIPSKTLPEVEVNREWEKGCMWVCGG